MILVRFVTCTIHRVLFYFPFSSQNSLAKTFDQIYYIQTESFGREKNESYTDLCVSQDGFLFVFILKRKNYVYIHANIRQKVKVLSKHRLSTLPKCIYSARVPFEKKLEQIGQTMITLLKIIRRPRSST